MKTLFQIQPPSLISSTTKLPISQNKFQIGLNINNKPKIISSSSSSCQFIIHKSLPFAASVALLLSATPASGGIMSGFSGLESVPGPELPQIDFLSKFNEENQKKYAENDARFKSSPILKELLERSKQNKEKNSQEIQDKYCIRGAEWGVGDCSTDGMTQGEKEKFIAMLKQKAGIKD